MRILIVEDSETLSEALNRSLKTEGYACDIAADGQAALQFLQSYRYDAIILDLMLPVWTASEYCGRWAAMPERPLCWCFRRGTTR
jgi:DNA-binding response OmpR family regulator